MGIEVEFNPDLALRNIEHYQKGDRKLEECIPELLEEGKVYNFLKKGQRNYWFNGEVPLLQTEGNARLSRPLASIFILEATHFLDAGEVYTKGQYKVKEVFSSDDPTVQFESYARVKKL
jgi:hypothetical protein